MPEIMDELRLNNSGLVWPNDNGVICGKQLEQITSSLQQMRPHQAVYGIPFVAEIESKFRLHMIFLHY